MSVWYLEHVHHRLTALPLHAKSRLLQAGPCTHQSNTQETSIPVLLVPPAPHLNCSSAACGATLLCMVLPGCEVQQHGSRLTVDKIVRYQTPTLPVTLKQEDLQLHYFSISHGL